MGLINLDNYVCSNGVQKTNTYISFANETLYVRQMPVDAQKNYTVSANYRVFWDEAARDNNLSFIDLKSVNVIIPSAMLNSNMYECLYEELKKIYPNTEDTLLRVRAPVAPVVSIPVAPVVTPIVAPIPVAPTPLPVEPVVAPVEPVVAPVAPVAPVEAPVAPVEPVAPSV